MYLVTVNGERTHFVYASTAAEAREMLSSYHTIINHGDRITNISRLQNGELVRHEPGAHQSSSMPVGYAPGYAP